MRRVRGPCRRLQVTQFFAFPIRAERPQVPQQLTVLPQRCQLAVCASILGDPSPRSI